MKRNEYQKNHAKLAFALLLVFLWIISGFLLPVSAEETDSLQTLPEGYSDLSALLPEETEHLLPDGIASENPEEVGEAVEEMSSPAYLFQRLGDLLKTELGSSLRLFATLCGLLLLAAVLGAVRNSLCSEALGGILRFCTTTAIFSAIISIQMTHLERVSAYFENLSTLMNAMIPITGTVWAMGGNVTTASAGTTTLYLFLTVCENLCAKTVLPMACFCTAMALCNTLSPDMGVRGLSSAVKKIYTFSLGLIMTILVSSLQAQTTLTAAADSTAARAGKTVLATVIPVVGGSVGDTLRTVASGVGYLKSVVGIGGILFVFLLVLPVLLSLIMTRLAFLLAGGVADMLGCDGESKLLGELGGIYGCVIAVVSMSAVMFILGLNIFVKTVVAAG